MLHIQHKKRKKSFEVYLSRELKINVSYIKSLTFLDTLEIKPLKKVPFISIRKHTFCQKSQVYIYRTIVLF